MSFWQEISKVLIQTVMTGGIALLGGWLAIRWGLRKYKAEKLYDRQLSAMADLLSSLREMSRVLEVWIPAEREMRELYKPFGDSLAESYGKASQKFEEVSAIAVLILPHDAADRVFNLEEKLGKIEFETQAQTYEDRLYLISDALTWLTDYAKSFRDLR